LFDKHIKMKKRILLLLLSTIIAKAWKKQETKKSSIPSTMK